jgi:glyoxylase-like metal-dependent hydrolase (beta-lactamase superfamily II)
MNKIRVQSQIFRRVLVPSLFLIILVLAITQYQSVDSQVSSAPFQPERTSDKDLLSNTVEALGGLKAIQDVKTQVIVAEGKRYEPGQRYELLEQPLPVSNFSYNLIQDLISDGLRMNWHRDIAYPYPNNLDYSIVIANNTGYTKGKDGLFSPEEAPMRQSAIDAILKEQLISSPLLLMQDAVKNPAIVQVQTDQMFRGLPNHVIALYLKENMPPIKIFLDNSTFLPTKVETTEDDPIHGDVLIEVFFDDWQEVNGVMFPFLVTHELNDEVTEERRSHVDTNVNVFNEAFTIPPNIQNASDVEEDPSRGWLDSQWYLRMHAFGIPHYDINHYANFTEMSPGIYHVTGSTHHSLVVEMNDYMVVVETPLYEERSQAVIDEISKRWPDKPIKYVVATHTHDDHIGGLRAYAAGNATIIGSEAALPEIEHILNSSHNIRPDSFQSSSPKQVRIDTVAPDEKMTINDGNRSIVIYPVNNSHSNDMLAVYLPVEKILLASDLYSPGGTPEPFRKYSRELLEFIVDNRIDVNIIVGTHGRAGGGPIEDLHDFVNLK